MTDEQKYKLNKASSLITDALIEENSGNVLGDKFLSTWLAVAADYCSDVAEDLRDPRGEVNND